MSSILSPIRSVIQNFPEDTLIDVVKGMALSSLYSVFTAWALEVKNLESRSASYPFLFVAGGVAGLISKLLQSLVFAVFQKVHAKGKKSVVPLSKTELRISHLVGIIGTLALAKLAGLKINYIFTLSGIGFLYSVQVSCGDHENFPGMFAVKG